MTESIPRRQWLQGVSAGIAGLGLTSLAEFAPGAETRAGAKQTPTTPGGTTTLGPAHPEAARSEPHSPARPTKFRISLNTSTVRGQKLSLDQVVDLAASVGYDGIEPWADELDRHVKEGGSLADLKKRIADHGLAVANLIAFPEWIVNDPARRAQGYATATQAMNLALAIGCPRIAAPPAGARDLTDISLSDAGERYRKLLEIGDESGVTPVLEFWGPSRTLSRLSEAVYVAIEADHPKASILADVYHMYKGASGHNGIRLLSAHALPVIHLNDYPTNLSRDKITDADRVFPGDGGAPLREIFRDLRSIGFGGFLSLELFNRDYWSRDAVEVARIGLEKTRAVILASESPAK